MSIADRYRKQTNPAVKFINFKKGVFQYWDKELEENVNVPMPFTFTVIDELATIKGWHEKSKSAIVANEVHATQHETLQVKSFKGGPIASGFYQEIKAEVKEVGGKYSKSVYALLSGELVNFQFSGAALGGWIEKEKGDAFSVSDTKKEKKGSVDYEVPIFVPVEIKDEMEAVRVYNDVLKPYFEEYKKGNDEEGEMRNKFDEKEEVFTSSGGPAGPSEDEILDF